MQVSHAILQRYRNILQIATIWDSFLHNQLKNRLSDRHIYPREGHGIVVLTNSEFGLPLANDIAEKALGGKRSGSFFSKTIKFTYDNLIN